MSWVGIPTKSTPRTNSGVAVVASLLVAGGVAARLSAAHFMVQVTGEVSYASVPV